MKRHLLCMVASVAVFCVQFVALGSMPVPVSSAIADFLAAEDARGARTLALIVDEKDRDLASWYGHGHSPATPSKMYSVSKSVTGLAIGAAALNASVDLNATLCELSLTNRSEWCDLKIVDLLQMRSGIQWSESYSSDDTSSDVLQMLFGRGARDRVSFVLGRPRASPPGSSFVYSSGDTMLLAAALREVAVPDSLRRWLDANLFSKIGLGEVTWEEDAAGNIDAASGLFLTAPQMLRIGHLMLEGGSIEGISVVSSGFFQESITSAGGSPYGYQWWLNTTPLAQNAPFNTHLGNGSGSRLFPDAPSSTFAAIGHFGQFIVVIPEEGRVIVRIADDRAARFDMNGLIRLLRGGAASGQKAIQTPFDAPAAVRAPKVFSAARDESVELALGFAATTYCSCRMVSALDEPSCLTLASPPGIGLIPVSAPWVLVDLFESRKGSYAKSALFRYPLDFPREAVRPGCVLVDDASYKVPN